jgi:hypothetical protein
MKWVEIITLRSPSKINGQFIGELLQGVRGSDSPNDTPEHLVEIKVYHHAVVETDLSIHIFWESEPNGQDKSPLGFRVCFALKSLGLLNHSVWIETAAREFGARNRENSNSVDIPEPDNKALQKSIEELLRKERSK